MNVIRTMATVTVDGCRDFRHIFPAVATVAMCTDMSARQGEIGALVVVKHPLQPVDRIVAALAFRTQATKMLFVLMARSAFA